MQFCILHPSMSGIAWEATTTLETCRVLCQRTGSWDLQNHALPCSAGWGRPISIQFAQGGQHRSPHQLLTVVNCRPIVLYRAPGRNFPRERSPSRSRFLACHGVPDLGDSDRYWEADFKKHSSTLVFKMAESSEKHVRLVNAGCWARLDYIFFVIFECSVGLVLLIMTARVPQMIPNDAQTCQLYLFDSLALQNWIFRGFWWFWKDLCSGKLC